MTSKIRNIFPSNFQEPKTESLKILSSKPTHIKHIDFIGDYGEILDLFTEKIDFGPIFILSQFYDPPLCCFTFFDFLLAPILEEFERIFDQTLKYHNSLTKLWRVPTPKKIGLSLGIDIKYMIDNLDTKRIFKGFSMKFLENQAI